MSIPNKIKEHFVKISNGLATMRYTSTISGGAVSRRSKLELSQGGDGEADRETASDEDYYVKYHRLLSAAVVTGHYVPVDYSRPGVLEKAVDKCNVTLFRDHSYHSINNALGAVVNPVWDGKSKPPGINAELHVVAHPHDEQKKDIAKGFADGWLNRCSVTIQFLYEQSHDMKERDFWERIGEMYEGELVRLIVTEVIDIYEVSLVFYGADTTAGDLDNGDVQQAAGVISLINQNQTPATPPEIMEETSMKTELQEKLEALLGQEFKTTVELTQAVAKFKKDREEMESQITALETRVNELTNSEEFETEVKTTALNRCMTMWKVTHPGEEMGAMTEDLYKTANYKRRLEYIKEMEAQLGFTCQDCHSTNVLRRSSVEVIHPGPGEQSHGADGKAVDDPGFKTIHS